MRLSSSFQNGSCESIILSFNSELIRGSPCMIFNNVGGAGGILVVAYN